MSALNMDTPLGLALRRIVGARGLTHPGLAPNGRRHLETLPTEILTLIFSKLLPQGSLRPRMTLGLHPETCITTAEIRDSRNQLTALCETGPICYKIAHELLYRILIIENKYELVLLFRTFVEKPHLRERVRTFAWRPTTGRLYLDFAEERSMMSERRKGLLDRIFQGVRADSWPTTETEQIPIMSITSTDNEFEMGAWTYDDLPATILAMMPRIKSLYIRTGVQKDEKDGEEYMSSDWFSNSFWALLQRDPPKNPVLGRPLQSLRTFSIENRVDNVPEWKVRFSIDSMLSLVLQRCPILLRIEQLRDDTNAYPPTDPYVFHYGAPKTLCETLEEVVTVLGTRPSAELPRLIRSLPKLRVLRGEYHLNSLDRYSARTAEKSEMVKKTEGLGVWKATRNALNEAKDSLQELHLTTRPRTHWLGWHPFIKEPGEEKIETPWLGEVLPKMRKLTSLTIEPMWLFNFNFELETARPIDRKQFTDILPLLPPNLEELTLIDYWGVGLRLGAPELETYSQFREYVRRNTPWKYWRRVLKNLFKGINDDPSKKSKLKKITIGSFCYPLIAGIVNGHRLRADSLDLNALSRVLNDSLGAKFAMMGIELVYRNSTVETQIPKGDWAYIRDHFKEKEDKWSNLG